MLSPATKQSAELLIAAFCVPANPQAKLRLARDIHEGIALKRGSVNRSTENSFY
jgi:hypothetical protein